MVGSAPGFKSSMFSSTDFKNDENDNFFAEPPPPTNYRHHLPLPPRHKQPRHFESTYRGQARAQFEDAEPKSFYNFAEELLPDLKSVIRPNDWNVHDFASWQELEQRAKTFEASKVQKEPTLNFEALITTGNNFFQTFKKLQSCFSC